VKLLLDTHAYLWFRAGDKRLPRRTRRAIERASVVFVSAATAWEASIKSSLGRLDIPGPVEAGVDEIGFEKLSISFAHAERAADLPRYHQDPFDRMLVAQAHLEALTLVSDDTEIAKYDVPQLW
jgi:PIN domain nuclease of toxin-antitoxin system